jgi:hypothetical protein
MPVRSGLSGFYEGGRPVESRLPDFAEFFHRAAGSFFRSCPPDLLEYWRTAAEIRFLMGASIESGLPPDSPPELVLLVSKNDKGDLISRREYEDAEAACLTSQ